MSFCKNVMKYFWRNEDFVFAVNLVDGRSTFEIHLYHARRETRKAFVVKRQ